MSSENVSRSYYFNPFTQIYSTEEGESCVSITLDASKEFSPDELTEAIKIYGNWLALNSIDYESRWIHENKCMKGTQSGAGQASGCSKKHLSMEEIEECDKMKQELTQQRCGGTHKGTSLYIKDVDFMKRVLGCVRAALSKA